MGRRSFFPASAGGDRLPAEGAAVLDPWVAADLELEQGDHWLLSYVDILTLLLTLLVVLLVLTSVPEPEPAAPRVVERVEASVPEPVIVPIRRSPPPAAPSGEPLERRLRLDPELARLTDLAPPVVERSPVPRSEPAAVARPLVPEPRTTEENPLDRLVARYRDDRLRVTRIAEGVNLEMRDSILFAPGSARLTAGGQVLLADLAGVLAAGGGMISVEGHTDDRPIATPRFPSNWELSTGRATAVARYLIDHGLPTQRVRAIGYASTRPLASNTTAEGRARNRRVSLRVRLTPAAADPAP